MAGPGMVAVIGLGRLGTSIALSLANQGVHVLALDIDERVVRQFADALPHVVCTDATDVVALQQAGVTDARQAIVAIDSSLDASMLCTLALNELHVPVVWAAASGLRHARILQHLGAQRVLLPAHDAAHQTAANLTRRGRWRMWYSSNDFAAATAAGAPHVAAWLTEHALRPGVAAAVKTGGQISVWRPGDALEPDSTIIVAGPAGAVHSLLQGGE